MGIFYKLRKLPDEILKQLYFAFAHSHITYAAEIYINTYDSYLDKLNKLNNKILLRILQNKNRYPITLLYRNFNTIPPSKLHKQQILLLLHKFFHHTDQLPAIFKDYFVLNSSVHNYNTRRNNNLKKTYT